MTDTKPPDVLSTGATGQKQIHNSRRVLKEITDVVSCAFGLPVQLFDQTEAETFYDTLKARAPYTPNFLTSKEKFEGFLKQVASDPEMGMAEVAKHGYFWMTTMPPGELPMWPIGASFANPFIRLFRGNWTWRWWEILWAQNAFSRGMTDNLKIHTFGGFVDECLISASIPLANSDKYCLVLGPCWLKSDESPARAQQLASVFVKKVDEAWHSSGLQNGKAKYRSSRLFRASFARKPVTKEDLLDRAKRAASALDLILEILSKLGTPINRQTRDDLYTFACLLHSDRLERLARLTGEYIHAVVNISTNRQPKERMLQLSEFSDGSPKVNVEMNFGRIEGFHDFGEIRLRADTDSQEEFLTLVSRYNDTIYSAWRMYAGETFDLTRNWLNDLSGTDGRDTGETWVADLLYLRHKDKDFAPASPTLAPPNQVFEDFAKEELDDPNEKEAELDVDVILKVGDRAARRAATLHNADNSVIYRANYTNRTLEVFGRFGKKTFDDLAFNIMDPHQIDAIQDHLVSTDGTNQVTSRVIVPIIHIGHTWGLLEIHGNSEDHFRNDHKGTLAEFASVFASLFFAHGMVRSLSKIRRISTNAEYSIDRRLDEICKELPQLFLCPSVTLHLPNNLRLRQILPLTQVREQFSPNDTRIAFTRVLDYRVRGFVERPDFEESEQTPSFNRSDKGSISANILNRANGFSDIETGVIGEGLFDEQWLLRKTHKILKKGDFRSICIAAIKHSEKGILHSEPLGTITLLSRAKHRFGKAWHAPMSFLLGEIATIMEPMFMLPTATEQAVRALGHELDHIGARISHTSTSISNIQESIQRKNEGNYITNSMVTQLDTSSFDLERLSSNLLNFTSFMMGDGFLKAVKTDQDVRIAYAWSVANALPDKLLLKNEFQNVFDLEGEAAGTEVHWTSGPHYQGPGYVLMHAENLSGILQILASNAVKYSAEGAAIHANIQEKTGPFADGIVLMISNYGPPFKREENKTIFEDTYRGSNTEEIPGKGRGLQYATEVARQIYGADISYIAPKDLTQKNVWHRFALTLPSKCIQKFPKNHPNLRKPVQS